MHSPFENLENEGVMSPSLARLSPDSKQPKEPHRNKNGSNQKQGFLKPYLDSMNEGIIKRKQTGKGEKSLKISQKEEVESGRIGPIVVRDSLYSEIGKESHLGPVTMTLGQGIRRQIMRNIRKEIGKESQGKEPQNTKFDQVYFSLGKERIQEPKNQKESSEESKIVIKTKIIGSPRTMKKNKSMPFVFSPKNKPIPDKDIMRKNTFKHETKDNSTALPSFSHSIGPISVLVVKAKKGKETRLNFQQKDKCDPELIQKMDDFAQKLLGFLKPSKPEKSKENFFEKRK